MRLRRPLRSGEKAVASTGGAGGQLGADLLSGLTVAIDWANSLAR